MRISMVSEHASPLASPGSVDAGGQNVHVAALAHALADRGHAVTVFTRRDAPHLPEREWLEPRVARDMDAVVATCSDEASELQAMGVPAQRIAIAPCGADTALFRPDGPVEPKRAPYRVAVVSRLVPRKGVDVAIEAMGRLAADGRRDIELVVAGSSQEGGVDADPEIARLRRLAGSLGVSDIVDFRGQVPREHIPALLRSADVAVCTPWYEPFGIVPLEAMACGTPVVA